MLLNTKIKSESVELEGKDHNEIKEDLSTSLNDDNDNIKIHKYDQLKMFIKTRFDPSSFAWTLEWSFHAALSFLLCGLLTIYMVKNGSNLPLLGPIITFTLSYGTFGQINKISQPANQGAVFVCCITTIVYCIPYILTPQYWYIALIYFSLISFVLLIILHNNSAQRKVALIYHTLFVLNALVNENKDLKYKIADIWLIYLIIPASYIIAIIALFIPYPMFSYMQLLYIENESITIIKNWLYDIIILFECTNNTDTHIQYTILKKYKNKSLNNKQKLYSLYSVSKHFELISLKNELLNEQRFYKLHSLHHILLIMDDAIKNWDFNSFHFKLLTQMKTELKLFVNLLNNTLSKKVLFDNYNKEIKTKLIQHQKRFLTQCKSIRENVFNERIKSEFDMTLNINALYTFIWLLQILSETIIQYLELRSKYETQKTIKKYNKFKLFCAPSIYKILNPFPFISFKTFKQQLSPFIDYKSNIFTQSLSICIALTISSIFFIYPPLHAEYQVGYWASIAVIVVSDKSIATSFQKAILRVEGTFFGVVCGFIIADAQIAYNLSSYIVVILLTIWAFLCGFYRAHTSKGYSGKVASTTAWSIAIGIDSKQIASEKYANLRIQFTFIGLVISLIILQIFSQVTAKILLHKQISDSLKLLKEMFNDTYNMYEKMVNGSNDIAIDDIISEVDDTNSQFINNMSHIEISKRHYECTSKVTQLLTTQKVLINAAVFEPVLWRKIFNQQLYFELNISQFWILRRIRQIDLCLRYLLKQNENITVINKGLVNDINPFIIFFDNIYKKSYKIIINSMEQFINQCLDEKENNNNNNKDIICEIHKTLNIQCIEFENLIKNTYKEIIKNNENNKQQYKHTNLSLKGSLLIHSLKFAFDNLMKNLSQFAESKVSNA